MTIISSEFYISWTKRTVLKLALPNHLFISFFKKHFSNTQGVLHPCSRCWNSLSIFRKEIFAGCWRVPVASVLVNRESTHIYQSPWCRLTESLLYNDKELFLLSAWTHSHISLKHKDLYPQLLQCFFGNKNINKFMFLKLWKHQVVSFKPWLWQWSATWNRCWDAACSLWLRKEVAGVSNLDELQGNGCFLHSGGQ